MCIPVPPTAASCRAVAPLPWADADPAPAWPAYKPRYVRRHVASSATGARSASSWSSTMRKPFSSWIIATRLKRIRSSLAMLDGFVMAFLQRTVRQQHFVFGCSRMDWPERKQSICQNQIPMPISFASRWALLSKSSEGRADAICGSFYNTGTVIGVPSRVKRFSTAART